MAKDTADKQTTDAFTRGRGRPRTSTPDKKRADTAERQRRHREKQKQLIAVAKLQAKAASEKSPSSRRAAILWGEVAAYLFAGGEDLHADFQIEYREGEADYKQVSFPNDCYSNLAALAAAGYEFDIH